MVPRRLPWTGHEVPHAVLDVGRGCDCACRACYNAAGGGFRPLAALARDVVALRRLRRLHTLTIAGGEPLLHPDLLAIVRLVKAAVPRCVLLTNGQRLDDRACAALAAAGCDAVFLHIDAGQRRRDLPEGHAAAERDALRRRLARRCSAHGLDAGLQITVYRSRPGELADAVRTVTEEPALRYLLATLCCDVATVRGLRGAVPRGLRARRAPATALATETIAAPRAAALLRAAGLTIGGFVGSSTGQHGPRWLSCGRAVRHADATRWRDLRPGLASLSLPRLVRLVGGRFAFFLPRSRLRSALLGALTPGRGGEVLDKWFVVQQGPEALADGTVVHCDHCPDAVVRGGRLVPVCLADAWEGP